MQIIHRIEQKRFVYESRAGEAYVSYAQSFDNIHFLTTFVPAELRGHGTAKQLVINALTWAKTQNVSVTSSCWYVDRFL